MSRLEQMLVQLGRSYDLAEHPDVAAWVVARLAGPSVAQRRPSRRAGAGLALAAAAVAAALGVSAARTSLLHFFGIRGASVIRVEQLPKIRANAPVAVGQPVTLWQAQRRVRFRVLLPHRFDALPTTVFVSSDPPGGQVALVYGPRRRPRLFLTEFRAGRIHPGLLKEAGPLTTVERVEVNGQPGIWLGGETHLFSFLDEAGTTRTFPTRLAGNTLVWERGPLTLRLESGLDKKRAVRLAEAIREPVSGAAGRSA